MVAFYLHSTSTYKDIKVRVTEQANKPIGVCTVTGLAYNRLCIILLGWYEMSLIPVVIVN